MTSDSLFGYHDKETSYLIILPLCVTTVTFDLFTLSMLLSSKRLRKLSNFPIISFMLSALIQDLLAMPLYLYRYIHTKFVDDYFWVCATYRFAYFYSGHTMKMNLLVVSFDRLFSIKFPLVYDKVVNKRNLLVILLCIWVLVACVDIIPFYMKQSENSECGYMPTHEWSLTVITMFNTIPFFVIVINYYIVWRIAFRKGLHDRRLRDSVNSFTEHHLDREQIRSSSVDDYLNELHEHDIGKYEINAMMPKKKPLTKTASRTSAFQFAIELKATRLSLAFMLTYLICWGPMAIFYLLDNACSNYLTSSKERSLVAARFTIKILSFSSSTLAPLVYIWRSRLFRREIQRKCFPAKFRHDRQASLVRDRAHTVAPYGAVS